MDITRNNIRLGHLNIVEYKIEGMDNLKYLRVDINKGANRR